MPSVAPHRPSAPAAVLVAVGLVVAAVATLPASARSSGTDGRVAAASPAVGSAAPAASAASVIADLAPRFLHVRPTLGPTWAVSPNGLSTGGLRLLASLQGLVNRSQVRMYVLARPTDQGLLDRYVADGDVDLTGTTDLGGALDRFAGEASGYVLASEDEPWTLNVGVTLASLRGALLVTPEHQAELEARGLHLLDDLRGRWPDAPTAYEALVHDHLDDLGYPGVAVLRPTDRSADWAYQQGMAVIFARPDQADWPRMKALLARFPGQHAIYGYLADTGVEEAIATIALSRNGQVLVASDTTSNLSFHVAVGQDRPRTVAAPKVTGPVAPCTSATVNVVVAISDGDNIVLPYSRYQQGDYWETPRRGDLPLGWSIGPGTAILAPALWDRFAATATAADELVPVIGYGYASGGSLPDPVDFYEQTFRLDRALGLTSFWSFAAGTELPSSPQRALIDQVAGDGTPHGLLVGYGGGQGFGYTPAGRPVTASASDYADTPATIADRIRALEALPASQRHPVTFFSASVWNNSAQGLIDALAPLRDEGVRFLTPSEAAACAPPAPAVPITTTTTSPPVDPGRGSGSGGGDTGQAPGASPVEGAPGYVG